MATIQFSTTPPLLLPTALTSFAPPLGFCCTERVAMARAFAPLRLEPPSASSPFSGEKLARCTPKTLHLHTPRLPPLLVSACQQSPAHASRAASLALIASLVSSSSSARALTAQEITDALLKVQDVTEKTTGAVGSAYGTVKAFLDQFLTTIKPAVDIATPYLRKATDAAIQAAAPIASDVASQADNALKSAGVDTKTVVDVAKTAAVVAGEAAEQTAKVIESAKPVASSTVDSIVSADPLFIAGGAGVLAIFYLLTPALLSSISYNFRGYKGDLSAPQVLDLLSKSNFILIDVRTEKEKSKSGLPSLPKNVKSKFLSIPLEELPGKIRGQLKNPRTVEAEIAALKISYLKRISSGSSIILLDSSGDISKSVAKSLSSLGFKNVWVVTDGFDGGKGWVQSRLGTESYNSTLAEVLSATRIIPAGTRQIFKSGTREVVDVSPRYNRLLPSGSDD